MPRWIWFCLTGALAGCTAANPLFSESDAESGEATGDPTASSTRDATTGNGPTEGSSGPGTSSPTASDSVATTLETESDSGPMDPTAATSGTGQPATGTTAAGMCEQAGGPFEIDVTQLAGPPKFECDDVAEWGLTEARIEFSGDGILLRYCEQCQCSGGGEDQEFVSFRGPTAAAVQVGRLPDCGLVYMYPAMRGGRCEILGLMLNDLVSGVEFIAIRDELPNPFEEGGMPTYAGPVGCDFGECAAPYGEYKLEYGAASLGVGDEPLPLDLGFTHGELTTTLHTAYAGPPSCVPERMWSAFKPAAK